MAQQPSILSQPMGCGAILAAILLGYVLFGRGGDKEAPASPPAPAAPAQEEPAAPEPARVTDTNALKLLRLVIMKNGFQCASVNRAMLSGESPYGVKVEVWCGPPGTTDVYLAQHYAVYHEQMLAHVCTTDLFADCS